MVQRRIKKKLKSTTNSLRETKTKNMQDSWHNGALDVCLVSLKNAFSPGLNSMKCLLLQKLLSHHGLDIMKKRP